MAREDSNDAVPSTGTRSKTGVDDRRPPLRLGGLAREHGDPAGEDQQRRIRLDLRVAEAASQRWTVDIWPAL